MILIQTMKDIQKFTEEKRISIELGNHFSKKLIRLHSALEPDVTLSEFSLKTHGFFALLERGDKTLEGLGLPQSLEEIMPEWISRLDLEGEKYYILYVMSDNDYVLQIYLPDAIVEETVRIWLEEQPSEEEGDLTDDTTSEQPF